MISDETRASDSHDAMLDYFYTRSNSHTNYSEKTLLKESNSVFGIPNIC
jgi:hypothetical protein